MKKSFFAFGVVALLLGGFADEGQGDIGVVATALTGNCSGLPGGSPLGSIDRIEVTVNERSGKELASSTVSLAAGEAELALKSVPVGSDNIITLLGYAKDANNPSWFGRRRDVSVLQDRTTEISLVLTRLGGFTCLTPPDGFKQRIFPSTVAMGGGKILITGGFTGACSSGDKVWKLTTGEASKDAFIYDPATGKITKVGSMQHARGGHTGVHLALPEGDKVVLFGGATELEMSDNGSYPFKFDASKGIDTYEVFDVATEKFETISDPNKPGKKMSLPRIFPIAAKLLDNTVLVSGGGPWETTATQTQNQAYIAAEIWTPNADDGEGGFLAFAGNLRMNTAHAGAGVAKLEDTFQGLSRYIVIGGTTISKNAVEIFTQSSDPEAVPGVFEPREVKGLANLYFPSVSKLRDAKDGSRRFLVAGGSIIDGKKILPPSDKAWILTVSIDDKIKRVSAEVIEHPCFNRFMHTASVSLDGDTVTFLGGFRGFGLTSEAPTCFFDVDKFDDPDQASQAVFALADGQEQFLSRGGHAAERLFDDTLLLVGGIFDSQTISDPSNGLLEIYASPVIKTNLAQ